MFRLICLRRLATVGGSPGLAQDLEISGHEQLVLERESGLGTRRIRPLVMKHWRGLVMMVLMMVLMEMKMVARSRRRQRVRFRQDSVEGRRSDGQGGRGAKDWMLELI